MIHEYRGVIYCPVKGLQAVGKCAQFRAAGMPRCRTCRQRVEFWERRSMDELELRNGLLTCPVCGGKKSKRSALVCKLCVDRMGRSAARDRALRAIMAGGVA